MKLMLLSGLLLFTTTTPAAFQPSISNSSQQLMLVLAPNTTSFQGTLQRYQRVKRSSPWQPVGKPLPVVLGQKGMSLNKQEGDKRTPLGVFPLGPVFGFEAIPGKALKMQYLPLRASTVCVDDPHSLYYNQLVDSAKLAQAADWHSAERMRQIPLYQEGVFVQYQSQPGKKQKGSCIFLHRWRGPQQGTAACVAMKPEDLHLLVTWLDARKKPLLALFTENYSNKDSFGVIIKFRRGLHPS